MRATNAASRPPSFIPTLVSAAWIVLAPLSAMAVGTQAEMTCLYAGAGRTHSGPCTAYWSSDSCDVSIEFGHNQIEVEGNVIDAPTVRINGWSATRETTNDRCFAVDGTDERFRFIGNWF